MKKAIKKVGHVLNTPARKIKRHHEKKKVRKEIEKELADSIYKACMEAYDNGFFDNILNGFDAEETAETQTESQAQTQ